MYEKINNDITTAMKTGDKFNLSVLRMFKAALEQGKNNQRDIPSDEEVIAILRKQIKLRESSKEEYLGYGKDELADNLQEEIDILSKYLPEELSDSEVEKMLDEVFAEITPESIKDMGNVMKLMTERIAGRYDMSKVSAHVKNRLG